MRNETPITREMLAHYLELNRKKKEVESEIEQLKTAFNEYFDQSVGKNTKGEMVMREYKLQRQIRKTEKFQQEKTVQKLEELNLTELIQKRPDEGKIKSAIDLGLIKEEDLQDCRTVSSSQAIYVKLLDAK
ncbi:hypothetical protein AB1K84_09635 [Mesobacillus foraminis]|uniref:Uncharacterized protein n=1 Tax=Mesobacillus foraminis TaxID=279826 RepID=A0A4R2BHU6_9BACI|nr:hypothetical protein [Mesobacillus foraminis]MBT2757276.1 hypothetical protein [Mesobacillus foraminis]TCN26668.1 hypothetical protein EV146_103191 [Mesobacillus foraminis]